MSGVASLEEPEYFALLDLEKEIEALQSDFPFREETVRDAGAVLQEILGDPGSSSSTKTISRAEPSQVATAQEKETKGQEECGTPGELGTLVASLQAQLKQQEKEIFLREQQLKEEMAHCHEQRALLDLQAAALEEREAHLQEKEKTLEVLEQQLAIREASIAQREKDLAEPHSGGHQATKEARPDGGTAKSDPKANCPGDSSLLNGENQRDAKLKADRPRSATVFTLGDDVGPGRHSLFRRYQKYQVGSKFSQSAGPDKESKEDEDDAPAPAGAQLKQSNSSGLFDSASRDKWSILGLEDALEGGNETTESAESLLDWMEQRVARSPGAPRKKEGTTVGADSHACTEGNGKEHAQNSRSSGAAAVWAEGSKPDSTVTQVPGETARDASVRYWPPRAEEVHMYSPSAQPISTGKESGVADRASRHSRPGSPSSTDPLLRAAGAAHSRPHKQRKGSPLHSPSYLRKEKRRTLPPRQEPFPGIAFHDLSQEDPQKKKKADRGLKKLTIHKASNSILGRKKPTTSRQQSQRNMKSTGTPESGLGGGPRPRIRSRSNGELPIQPIKKEGGEEQEGEEQEEPIAIQKGPLKEEKSPKEHKKSATREAKGVFGKTIEEIMRAQREQEPELEVPRVLSSLVERLKGEYTEGLFGTSPSIAGALRLKQRINQGNYDTETYKTTDVVTCLKMWIRDLKEPLFEEEYYEQCLSASTPERAASMLGSLKDTERRVAIYVAEFIGSTSDQAEQTEAARKELCQMFACCFLRSTDVMKAMMNADKEAAFIERVVAGLKGADQPALH